MKLNDKQKQILKIICDTFTEDLTNVKNDKNQPLLHQNMPNLIDSILFSLESLPIAKQNEFKQLLDLMGSFYLGLTWFGPLKSFDKLSPNKRIDLLISWSKSMISPLRNAFNSLRKLVTLCYYSAVNENGINPQWEKIKYPNPPRKEILKPYKTDGLITKKVQKDTRLTCDVVIIGSGAGGGVVAATLAAKGLEVIILEKGEYITEEQMSRRELEMTQKTIDRRGALASEDGSTTILAGSCVGGGTTINWSASFRTPDFILEEWAKEHDNPQFLDNDYKKCFEHIEKRAHISTQYSIHDSQNQKLVDACKKAGYSVNTIARNVRGPVDENQMETYWKMQGYANFGDAWGYKQGTMKTFLQDASDNGALLYANTRVEKVIHKNGKVEGVLAFQKDNNQLHKIDIQCKKVVVSAGAIHSPAILKRSGLQHKEIGNHLYLHPVNAVAAEYDETINGWYGPLMTAVCDEFKRLDGNFGYVIETPPLHSGFIALATPWQNAHKLHEDMKNISKTAAFLVLTRDKFGGKIKLSKEGRALVHYKLNPYDRKHLIHGIKECVKLHHLAGATKIRLLHNQMYEWNNDINIHSFINNIDKINWNANHFTLFSAHQMGTCRMGGRDKDHPLKPNGETREVKNLYVADASAFPRCSGVNPMLSIQALSYYIAKGIE